MVCGGQPNLKATLDPQIFTFSEEAMRDQISSICSSLLVGELILHPEKYPQKLAAVRKVCKVLAQELGMARADLSPVLSNKLEEFLKTEEFKE